MIYRVLGRRDVSFYTKEGNKIEGSQIFVSYDDSHTQGVATDRLFFSTRHNPYTIMVGDDIEVFYNRYGKVDSFKVLE